MTCPNCGETLLMTERLKVEIDYCPKCRGVWLDKGELDKLLDIAAQQMEQQKPNIQQQPSYKQEYYKEDYHKHHKEGYYPKKKKSFLSDFLDFD
jgi:Zn-finger nucleic acid-binding protein